MVVLSEKDLRLVPPPPYFAIEHAHSHSHSQLPDDVHSKSSSLRDSGFESARSVASCSASSGSNQPSTTTTGSTSRKAPPLPSHILLLIVYSTLPFPGEVRLDRATGLRRRESAEETAVRTTRTLYWMAFCLRAVSKGFYLASMHILRSTFLSYYVQRVRVPYSSDPFPHTSLASHRVGGTLEAGSSSLASIVRGTQSESEVLDLYILHQLHEDVFADDSSLHTARPDTLRDLFDFMQPRARLADLLRLYGAGAGLVALSDDEVRVEEEILDADDEDEDEDENEEGRYDQTSSSSKNPYGSYPSLKEKLARSSSTLTLASMNMNVDGASSSQTKLPLPSYTYTLPFSSASTPSSSTPSSTSARHAQKNRTRTIRRIRIRIPHTALRISFSPRRVGIVYTPPHPSSFNPLAGAWSNSNSNSKVSSIGNGGAPRTIVDIPRERDEPLERSASRLVGGLKVWMEETFLN